jgi:hypothetical protein
MKRKILLTVAALAAVVGLGACQPSFTRPAQFTHPPVFQPHK